MKNKFLIHLALFCMTVSVAVAERFPTDSLPKAVLNVFKQTYPEATDIEWEKENQWFVVEFETGRGSLEHKVWYDSEGKQIRHEEEIPFSALPEAVVKRIKSDYPTYHLDDLKKLTEGLVSTYSVELKSGKEEWDLLLDSEGNFLSKTED